MNLEIWGDLLSFKSFTLGLGMGIVFISLIFGIVYHLDLKRNSQTVAEAPPALSDAEIIQKAKALGMISYVDLPKETTVTNDDFVKQRAAELGMVFLNEETPAAADTTFAEDTGAAVATAAPEVEYAIVRIPSGANATSVSRALEAQNVIDDADAFNRFIIQKRKSTRLRAGNLKFPLGASYEDVLQVLTTRKK